MADTTSNSDAPVKVKTWQHNGKKTIVYIAASSYFTAFIILIAICTDFSNALSKK